MSTSTIESLIPHREPFIMIDALIKSDPVQAFSSLKIHAKNILVDDGNLTESGLIENIAQTAAAGLRDNDQNAAPRIGYIGSLKNLSITRLPVLGETIFTEVKFMQEIMGAKIVQGLVRVNEEVIASCELRIFIQQLSTSV